MFEFGRKGTSLFSYNRRLYMLVLAWEAPGADYIDLPEVVDALDLLRELEKMVSCAGKCCHACASFRSRIVLCLKLKISTCRKHKNSKEKLEAHVCTDLPEFRVINLDMR